MTTATANDKQAWVKWLESYGADGFFDAFIRQAQGAKSTCVHCGEAIYLDIVEGGGVPDWGTSFGDGGGLDYGCVDSPDTNDEGTGEHEPERDADE